jgi:ASC-1-like (ASCH) protein
MKLNPQPFELIMSGIKTIELRLNDEKRQLIHIEDEIVFENTENSNGITVKVLNIYKYESFEDLYNELPLLKCGYTEEDIDTANASDMDTYYSKEVQQKFGVLGIEIELLQ